MKFKKSHILLIAIAILLLISIGAVCASENVTDDSDDTLADDGTNVVLSDTDGNVPDDTNKINTTVETDKDSYEFKQDSSNKTIPVEVKDNKTNKIAINKSDLSISNGVKNISFEYNSSVITITEQLAYGHYNLTINYLGNGTYINSSKVISMKIYGNNTIETQTSVVCDGKNIEIPVKIKDQVDYIKLIQNNFNLTLVYTNETGNVCNLTITSFTIENDTIKFTTPVKLIGASVIINYTNATEPKTVAIKVSTEVKAETDKDKFKSEEIKNISIKIFDGQGNLLNVTKNDLKVFDNGNEITNFKYNNSNITLDLGAGVHNVKITYKGNETYNASSGNITIKVSGNLTFNPDKTAAIDDYKKVTITINLSDGADYVDINQTKLNVTVFYTINNQTLNKTVDCIINGQNITFDLAEDFETAYANIKYDNLVANTTIKVGTHVVAPTSMEEASGKVINFIAMVYSVKGTGINVTENNTKVYVDGKEVKFTYNDSSITLNDTFAFGIYNLTVKYLGTETLSEASKSFILTVYGINATSTTNVNSTKEGNVELKIINGNETVDITASELTLNVTYKDGNNTIVIPVASYRLDNGTLYFTLENGNFTTATLNIRYNNTETNVTLNRIYNVNIIPITVTADYEEGNFTFKLVDIDSNEVVTNKTVSVSMTKGGTSIYFITKTSSGGYNLGTTTTLTSDENGIATLDNENFYPGLMISDNIFAPVGKYLVTVTGSGAVKGTNTTNITIEQIDVNIALENYEEYYGSDKKVKIIVTNVKTGKTVSGVYILLNISGATLSSPTQITDANGTIQLGVSGLYPNKFNMTFKSNDTNLKNSSGSGSFTIKKIPVVISGSNVNVYYNSGTTYTIKVTKNGKALSGMYIIVRLYSTSSNYSDYLFQTNNKGQVAFSASLAVGKHKIIINSADTRYSASQVTKTITVKKASVKITAKKVTDYYKGVKYFTVKLTNSKTKKPVYDAKINIKVYISKTRYYNYNGNTGMNGQIKLALDTLKPGTYIVEVLGADKKNFDAKMVTSKIVIKKAPAKLSPKKLTAKKGAKKYFKVKVTNKKTKKVISKVKVKIKVYTGKKAKTYTAKTNAKGIAKISTAKLKVGKHKVVVTSANKYVTAKKAKSTIKIKK